MSPFDTAIVGAGAAGIAAARLLRAAGQHVVVLEARQRAGGRAVTDHSLGAPADLGAAWLHFARDNAWTTLAEEAGFALDRRRPGWGAGAAIGAHVPDEAERAAAGEAYARYFDAVDAAGAAGRDVPVADVVPHDAYRPRFDAVMTWAVGVESHAVSTLDLYRYAESADDWGVPAGLGSVVAHVAQDLPIHTGFVVTDIHWSGPIVRIEGPAGRIEAKSVIVTVPTAVLAAGGIRFDPLLPAPWRDALPALPLGVVNKVFFRLLAPPEQLGIPRHFLGSASTSRTFSWSLGTGGHPLLMAFCGGDLSAELELRGELVHCARDELLSLFGADIARHLGASLATGWGADPFARGSYSAALPGQANSRAQLALPVSPRLQFAGEACSPAYYGTLYGAWLSGREAANRLL